MCIRDKNYYFGVKPEKYIIHTLPLYKYASSLHAAQIQSRLIYYMAKIYR